MKQSVRFIPLMIAFLITIFGSSCKKDKEGFLTTENGLKYRFITSNKGTTPQLGDVMILDILYKTPNDSVLFDSKSKSDSFTVKMVAPTFVGGVEEGFAMMSIGDSALFKASADSLFEKTFQTTLPAYLKPGDMLQFFVKLKNIIPHSYQDSLDRVKDIDLRKVEFAKIDTFLTKNNMDVMPTENGAYLLITRQGSGDFPQKGDTVAVTYSGHLIDGTIFDEAIDRTNPFTFVVGQEMVIPGWEECLPRLNKGSKARMVIPSDLGYGAEPYGKLPGYATLIFDVEVIDVRSGRLPN